MPRRNAALFTALILAALLTGWIAQQLRSETPPARDASGHRPDFFLDDFELVTHNEDGRPVRHLNAPRLVHYRDDDSTEIEWPRARLLTAAGTAWEARSTRGWVSAKGEHIRLDGDVQLQRPGSEHQPPVALTTQRLWMIPEDDYLETDRPVTLYSEDWTVEARGMRAWIREGRLHLISQVRGTHAPFPSDP